MFCYKCGTQIHEGGEFCHCCGTPAVQQQYQPQTQPQYPPQNYIYVKPRVPGRGLGIAGMVLGIIGLPYSFVAFIAALDYAMTYPYSSTGDDIVAVIFLAVFPILAVSLAGSGRHKGYKCGVSTSGIVMGVIGLVMLFIALIAFVA